MKVKHNITLLIFTFLLITTSTSLILKEQDPHDLLASGKYMLNSSIGSTNPLNLVDKNEKTIWSSQKFAGNNGQAWIEFSFPEPVQFNLIEISWKVPATSFSIEYQNQNGEVVPHKHGRNRSSYGDYFHNELEVDILSSKLKIKLNQRVFASILSGGDLDDGIDELGYEIREIKLYGMVEDADPAAGN